MPMPIVTTQLPMPIVIAHTHASLPLVTWQLPMPIVITHAHASSPMPMPIVTWQLPMPTVTWQWHAQALYSREAMEKQCTAKGHRSGRTNGGI